MGRKKTKRVLLVCQFVFFLFIFFYFSSDVFCSGAIPRIQKQRKAPVTKVDYSREVLIPKVSLLKRVPQQSEGLRYQENIIDFDMLWAELKITSEAWPLISEKYPKEVIVSRYIALFARQDILIDKPSSFYVEEIDRMAEQNKNLFKSPFKDVLKFVAIVEYDFDNGQDRDALARSMLGEVLYRENRKRIGLSQ